MQEYLSIRFDLELVKNELNYIKKLPISLSYLESMLDLSKGKNFLETCTK